MAKIVHFKPKKSDIVEKLEELVEMAKNGEITNYVVGCDMADGNVITGYHNVDVADRMKLVSHMHIDIVDEVIRVNHIED